MPPRLIGLFALATMERDGPVHGYLLSERIAEKTAGAWRPGPGAVYPSLQALVERGLARRRGVGRRREYRITARGRQVLQRIRRTTGATGRGGPDLSALWGEVVGAADAGSFLVRRLERNLLSLTAYLDRRENPAKARAARRAALRVLTRAQKRLAASSGPPRRSTRGKP